MMSLLRTSTTPFQAADSYSSKSRSSRRLSVAVKAAGSASRDPTKRISAQNWLLEEPGRLWEIGSRFWLPFNDYAPPKYLDGTLPGDRGFDPLQLGASWGSPPNDSGEARSRIGWLLEGELYNGRVAMLAAAGILAVELLGRGPWYKAVNTGDFQTLPFVVGVVAFHTAFALLEKTRIENFEKRGEAGHFGQSPFDPLGQTNDYNRQAEVRNARTAMLANLGFWTQAWVTAKGPLENAVDHLKDPFGANIFTYGDRGYQVVAVFLTTAIGVHLAELNRTRSPASGSRRSSASESSLV